MKKVLLLLLSTSVLLLAACQSSKISKSSSSAGASEASGEDVSTEGLNDFDWDFQRAEAKHRFKVPHDQVYYFGFDSNVVSEADLRSIVKQSKYIAEHPSAKVFIAGHTDERGSPRYNVGLGHRRANSVVDIMMLNGVKKQQIHKVSYGQEKPAQRGIDEESYAKNRRVEFKYEDLG